MVQSPLEEFSVPRSLPFLAAPLLLLAVAACDRTADLIPGEPDDATPEATATANGDAAPLLPPASLAVGGAGEQPASTTDSTDAELARSVVQIRVIDEGRIPPVLRDGSGVVIDAAQGLILTSALVVQPFDAGGAPAYSSIEIATSAIPGGEPSPTHRAVLAGYDPVGEFAVLRVVGRLGDEPQDDAAGDDSDDGEEPLLDLPAATIGDSAALKRGDALRLFGHPGLDPSGAITSQSVLVTAASMTGARGDPVESDRAWLKTDARLPHGSGGGPVFDEGGGLVGIASQIAYSPTAPVAQIRPIALAETAIAQARASEDGTFVPLLVRHNGVPGSAQPQPDDGVAISAPVFAREAIEEGGERDLFDYARSFPSQTAEVQYEFVVQGVPNGATVQELWYLDDVFQDELSASYNWELGPFAVVSDRLSSPNPLGNPDGVWRLEVWVDGTLRSSGHAYLGVSPPTATVGEMIFAAGASADRVPGEPPFSGAPQILAFFDYEGAAAVERLRWVVFHDEQLVYQSPSVPWRGGERGTWWVGLPRPDGLEQGAWEFELYIDDADAITSGFELP